MICASVLPHFMMPPVATPQAKLIKAQSIFCRYFILSVFVINALAHICEPRLGRPGGCPKYINL